MTYASPSRILLQSFRITFLKFPPHPWHTLGSDLFYFQRIDFLVVVDYFSKFLIVRKIPSSTSSAIIKELGMIFSEFGNPQIFRSDNGPCYSSQEFKLFMQNWLVEHRNQFLHIIHRAIVLAEIHGKRYPRI